MKIRKIFKQRTSIVMELISKSIKNINSKRSRTVMFYVGYIAIISILLFIGLSGNIHADSTNTATDNSVQEATQQYNNQDSKRLINKVVKQSKQIQAKKQKKPVKRIKRNNNNWFRDGLSNRNLRARSWVSWHESRHNWKILSYGHRCIGYFQLDPAYLGYRHGHVNLNHKHQVQVADAYAKNRYGSWVNAKRFWQAHHWY